MGIRVAHYCCNCGARTEDTFQVRGGGYIYLCKACSCEEDIFYDLMEMGEFDFDDDL